MSLPYSLIDVKEYWLFEEGSGTLAAGALGELDLTLSGSWGPSSTDGLWGQDGDGTRHKAAGTIPGPWELLEAVDSACTIAVEVDFAAQSVDPYTGMPYDGTVYFAHLRGGYSALDCVHTLREAPPEDPATNTHVYYGNGVGAGDGMGYYIGAPPYASMRYTLIIECVRVNATDVRVRLFRGATQIQDDGVNAWDATNTDFYLGDAGNRSLIRNAAIWLRTLTETEKNAIDAEGLDGLPDLDEPEDETGGVDADGKSVWTFDFPARGVRRVEVLVSEGGVGGQRHTRRVGERVTRRYELVVTLASGAELARLRTVLAASRGEAGSFLWAHPIDDASPVLYRFGGEPEIRRTAGGQRWEAGLVFEEV